MEQEQDRSHTQAQQGSGNREYRLDLEIPVALFFCSGPPRELVLLFRERSPGPAASRLSVTLSSCRPSRTDNRIGII